MRQSIPVPVSSLMALSDGDKQRVWESFNREIPFNETKPLTAPQRNLWGKAERRAGRPKVGSGAKVISLSVEKELLAGAECFEGDYPRDTPR